jgi:uncharacterized membrane-anchored protein YjiN (DUF445 family)
MKNTRKTHTVVFQNETIKVRTRCENFGLPNSRKECEKCMKAQNKIGFACNVKNEELKPVETAKEIIKVVIKEVVKEVVVEKIKEVMVKPTVGQLKEMFTEEELKAMLQEIVGEPETIKEVIEPNIKRRKGTKMQRLAELIKEGVYTKNQLVEKLSSNLGTLNVYITKLRKEFGMLIDTPKDGLVTCAA